MAGEKLVDLRPGCRPPPFWFALLHLLLKSRFPEQSTLAVKLFYLIRIHGCEMLAQSFFDDSKRSKMFALPG